MPDLGLVETDALLAELHSRFDGSLFCGEQQRGEGGGVHRRFRYEGSMATCIGLAVMMQHWMTKAEMDRPQEPGEGDES